MSLLSGFVCFEKISELLGLSLDLYPFAAVTSVDLIAHVSIPTGL